jgi:hypothetical protein
VAQGGGEVNWSKEWKSAAKWWRRTHKEGKINWGILVDQMYASRDRSSPYRLLGEHDGWTQAFRLTDDRALTCALDDPRTVRQALFDLADEFRKKAQDVQDRIDRKK